MTTLFVVTLFVTTAFVFCKYFQLSISNYENTDSYHWAPLVDRSNLVEILLLLCFDVFDNHKYR